MTSATIWSWILATLVGLLALGWLWQLAQWLMHSSTVIDLNDLNEIPEDNLPGLGIPGLDIPGLDIPGLEEPPQSRPHLTFVVPACNEQESIAKTLHSLLASREIRLQVIAVDDRSTDRTGQIMDEIQKTTGLDGGPERSGHTLQVLHIRELPPDWLGKPHALASAARLARADWILFTDADVTFAPETASLALRHAQAERADHLVLMPDWTMETHGEAAMHGAMHALTTWAMRPWRVADPEARDFLGVGAFNLVRRSTYEALGGFESLRMEIVEDLRFGWKLKRAGFRQRVVLGPGLASVRWSQGAWGVVKNLEKNLFALYRYRVGLTLLACFGLVIQIVLPLAALAMGGWPRLAAIVLYAAIAGIYVVSRKVTRVAPAYVLVYPLAVSVFLFAMLRSLILTLVQGGVVWRGTLYSLKDLRDHAGPGW